jgi:hypothetical protein
MATKRQAEKSLRRSIKQRMADRMTVRELARRVDHHESVVSKAINHGEFPRVLRKIREALSV